MSIVGPPIFSDIDKRVQIDQRDGDSAFFLALSSKLEFLTKVTTLGLLSCVEDEVVNRYRYSIEHRLVRANSLGDWVTALNEVLVGPAAQFILSNARHVTRQLTERVAAGDARHTAVSAIATAANEIGCGVEIGGRVSLRQFFEIGVRLRNRSRAHGAPTTMQLSRTCLPLSSAIDLVVGELVLFKLPWAYLHQNLSGKYRVSRLAGDDSPFDRFRTSNADRFTSGVYLYLDVPVRLNLIYSDPDLRDIALPNGNYHNASFETLSYITNDDSRQDGTEWSYPPGQLPPSDTEGRATLDLLGDTFTNLPPLTRGYVHRRDLEETLQRELASSDRHPIVSLTGPGGIGKTTIAIGAIRDSVQEGVLPYEVVLWISARDIDLLDHGAKSVQPKVISEDDISTAAVELLEPEERLSEGFDATKYFEECLTHGAAGCTLFVLDNFETMRSPADVFAWIDAHIRPPNKVLITTRIRDFRGDYHIDIGGMSDDEAAMLVDGHAARLGIDDLITDEYRSQLVEESVGHPYVLKIMLGKVAMEGKISKPERILASTDHILRALFERTFSALSLGAQRIFLLLSSWRVLVPEVAVEAVLLRPETARFDVAEALDQLYRFSLVERIEAEEEGQALIGVPLVAEIYARRKLQASRIKASVEEDRRILMEFGADRPKDSHQRVLPRIESLYRSVAARAQGRLAEFEESQPLLEYLAERIPIAFLGLSDLVWELEELEGSTDLAKEYIRRYLEVASPLEKPRIWAKLADRCRSSNDELGEIHALCEAAIESHSDVERLGEHGNRLNNRIRAMKEQRRDIVWSEEIVALLAGVTAVFEKRLSELNATNCSRLAWLYLNVGRTDRARDVAKLGLQREPSNEYCQRLVQKLGL